MSSIYGLLSSGLSGIATALVVILIIFNLLQCFFGYKLLKLSVAIIGFIIGVSIGYALMAGTAAAQNRGWLPVLVGIIIGIILGILSFRIYLAGVFVLTACVTGSAIFGVLAVRGVNEVICWIAAVAAGILIGILAVKFTRPLTIIVTAIFGAVNAVNYLNQISTVLSRHQITTYAAIGVLAILGIIVQFLTTKKGA